jgi:hypothetical protein
MVETLVVDFLMKSITNLNRARLLQQIRALRAPLLLLRMLSILMLLNIGSMISGGWI